MSSTNTSQSIASGARLGNYVLGARLAAGGMAEVYHAEPIVRRFGSGPIVLKRMHPHLAANRECVDMFIDEARISTRLEHPNIVRVFDFEATERGLFLVMELVDGPDLLSIMRRRSKNGEHLPVELAVYIACHALEALDYAHGAAADGRRLGVVHRDVSPSNLLITRRGQVKLADFGIARATERQQKTAEGTLKGKYGYMSPEQVLGRELDGRSDVFALGVVLAEMLMSRRLFIAAGDLETLLMVRRGDLSRLDKYGGHIPPALRSILRKALARDVDERYQSAGAFRDQLSDWLATCAKRTGAASLAQLIREMEEKGGDLCEWGTRPSSAGTSPTMSGHETKLARLAIKKRAAEGRKIFALGGTSPNARAPKPVVEEIGLGRYDGSVLAEIQSDNPPTKPTSDEIKLERGSIENTPVVDLLCEIARRELTGFLLLRTGDQVKEAYFRNGHPDFVRSNVPSDRFGQFLVARGVLTPAQLERTLAALPHFEGRMGQALVSLDLLRPVDAVHLLAKQVTHKLVDACTWTEGRYVFREGIANPHPALELRLNTRVIVGKSLDALPREMLLAWGKRYRGHTVAVDMEAAVTLELPPRLAAKLHALTAEPLTLGELARKIPSRRERRIIVAALHVLWRLGAARLTPTTSTEARGRRTSTGA